MQIELKASQIRKKKMRKVRNEKISYNQKFSKVHWSIKKKTPKNQSFRSVSRSVPRCLPMQKAQRSQTPSEGRKFSLTSVLDTQKQRIKNKIKKIVTNLDLISFNKDRSHLSRKKQNLMYMKIMKQEQHKEKPSECQKQIQKHGYRFFITESKMKKNKNKENLNNG